MPAHANAATRTLASVTTLISSGKTTRRDHNGRNPLYGSMGQIGNTNRTEFMGPSILVARVGANAGSVYSVDGSYGVTDNTLVIRPKTDQNVLFLTEVLRFADLNRMVYGSGQPLVTGTMLKRLEIPSLTSADQRKIASVLGDASALIGSLERLIEKRQAIKQGIMQQLLSHRSDTRHMTALNAVTGWLSGGTPDRSNASYWAGTIPWISATTLKHIEVSDSVQKVSATAVRVGSKMAPIHSTLLLVRGSALHSEIRASLVTAPVCFNQDVKALVPSSRLVPKFLTYSIHGNADKLLRLVTSAGNTAGVLDTAVLKAFQIWLPDRTEQERIVSILDDVTAEIDTLEAQLDKSRAIKQGIMQELLTGRTRLPLAEATS
jgi:type I restriction enzyme, S subunit